MCPSYRWQLHPRAETAALLDWLPDDKRVLKVGVCGNFTLQKYYVSASTTIVVSATTSKAARPETEAAWVAVRAREGR